MLKAMIAITGGPSGGKSQLMTTLMEKLGDRGYKVLVVPEAARKFIAAGIIPGKTVSLKDFQQYVLNEQLLNEQVMMDAAAKYENEKGVVILCDRGLADQLAYIDRDMFEPMLADKGLTISSMYARYTCAIHLVTAADGAVEFYAWSGHEDESKRDLERYESPEDAIALDKRTQNAWIGHPHMRVVDNSTDFVAKKLRALEEVFSTLGEPVPMEIERKFLIKMPTQRMFDDMGYTSKSDIIQTYLKTDGIERRIRQRGTKQDGFSFYYTEKKPAGRGQREEYEIPLSWKDYVALLAEADTSLHQISKQRYCFLYDKRYFELDIYPFSSEYAILEIEVKNIDEEITLPPFDIVKEVTDDAAYKNKSLAKTLAFPVEV